MSIELKLAATFLVLFFLTAPVGAFSIGKRWFRWGLCIHYGPLALAALSLAAFAIRKVWE